MNMIMPLIGVLIGGLITYIVQTKSIKETHRFEREKIREEDTKKNKELKFKAYNEVLYNDTVEAINVYDMHSGWELNYKNYAKFVRPVLFNIYHLLDEEIAEELLRIENIYTRVEATGEPEEDDENNLSKSYDKIKILMRGSYGEW